MILIATIGAKALYLLFVWLLSATVGSWLSERKGYGERVGLAFGMILSAIGLLLVLLLPGRPGSAWKEDGWLPGRRGGWLPDPGVAEGPPPIVDRDASEGPGAIVDSETSEGPAAVDRDASEGPDAVGDRDPGEPGDSPEPPATLPDPPAST
jgi:hypothetical protein